MCKIERDEVIIYNGTKYNNIFPRGYFQINQTVYFNDVEHGKLSPKASHICVDIYEIYETDVVISTMKWYGILFVIYFLLYTIVIPRFPLLYSF